MYIVSTTDEPTMVLSEIGIIAQQNNIPFGWQTRFHDRIIRNHAAMNRIAQYIENNVANSNL